MQKAFEKRSLLSCSWSTQEQPWSPLKARSEDVVTVMTGQCSKRTFFFLVRYIPWSCHERQDLEYREHRETVGIAFWCAGYDVCVVRLWPGIYPEFRFRWGADTKLSVEGLSIWMKFRRGGKPPDGVLGGCINFWRGLMTQSLHVVTTILWMRIV